jgi:hypothetical protein
MANKKLLYSSLIFSFFHLYAIMLYHTNVLYTSFLLMCLTTSILNHALTSRVWLVADRIMISIGAVGTFFVAPYSCAVACVFYGSAKIGDLNWAHIVAHLLITAINISTLRRMYFIGNK